METDELLFQIALTQVAGIGPVIAKNLISYCGSASAVFKSKRSDLLKIPVIGEATVMAISGFRDFSRTEQEIRFIEENGIRVHFYADRSYPFRLKENRDCPVLLYQKGHADLNHTRVLGVVGTRKPTEYGRQFCEQLVAGLSGSDVVVISGMAYGIDVCAHKAAIRHGIPTVGILAHGLDRIYPPDHRRHIQSLLAQQGGLVSEYISGTLPEREHFPMRNRIVAGLCDALVVVETAARGGSMITAELAWQYDRALFALPGRVTDERSEGCNDLIRNNKAELLTGPEQLATAMNWLKQVPVSAAQRTLPLDLTTEEKGLLDLFKSGDSLHMDDIAEACTFSGSRVALTLLELEFRGLIRSLPGKRFQRL